MSRTLLGGAAAVAVVLLTACGGAPAGDANQPAPSSPVSPIAAPSGVSPGSQTPVPSPTASRPPDRRHDQAALQRALVTAEDLGRPWVVVKGGQPTGPVEAGCPGKPSAVRKLAPVAEVSRDLTKGRGELINAVSFRLSTLRDRDGSAVRAAWRADTSACRHYTDGSGFFVVYRVEGPSSVRNADELLFSRAELIYFDRADPEPAYARHTLVARTGRVVTTVTYSFLTSKAGAGTNDFSQASELLQTQLSKAANAFPG